jgi:hypothetical protein
MKDRARDVEAHTDLRPGGPDDGSARPMRRRRALLVLMPLVLMPLVTVAACAPGVSVQEAPHGAIPLCASVVLALPDRLGGLPRLATTSQASAAWGTAAAPVVLRCGVDVPGPTTVHCVTVDTTDGPSIDWLALPDDPNAQGATSWTFTTYGRDPAVEVQVPQAVTSTRSTSFLDELGPAVAQVHPTRSCL